MKTNLLNKLIIVFSLILVIALVSSYSYAASSLSIAAGSTNLTVGSSTTLTIRGNNVIGRVSITSSNPGVISLSSSSEWIEGAVTVRATANAAGSAYITVTSADTSDATTGDAVSVSTGVNLTSKAVVVDTRSSNNYLSSLAVEGYELSPAFNTNTNNYTMNVGSDINEIKLSAIPADNKARTMVDGNLDLVAGENNVTVTVTAENGYKRVYTITVTKEKNPDDIDATIESLVINNAVLKNDFSSDVFEYMCDDITADIAKLDFQINTKIPDLKYEITGNDELKQGINHIVIKVTSRDGSVTKEYKIIVFKTDEVLALQDVMNDIPEVTNNTLLDKIKLYKYQIIIALLAVIIVILIIVLIVKSRKKSNYNEEVEIDTDKDATEEYTEQQELDVNVNNELENFDLPQIEENIQETIEEVKEIKVRKGSLATSKKQEMIVEDTAVEEKNIEPSIELNIEDIEKEIKKEIDFSDKKDDNKDLKLKLDLSSLEEDNDK